MINAEAYRKSRLGITNEAMKVAYSAGKRIFVLVTKDYSIGAEIVEMQSMLPLDKGSVDTDSRTAGASNFHFATNDSFFEHTTRLSKASIFLYSGKKFPENSVKAFVDALQGYTMLDRPAMGANMANVQDSMIIILCNAVPSDIPDAVYPYVEIVKVPLICEDEFGHLVSEWLNQNEGVPAERDASGYLKINDADFLKGLYHNMRGLAPVEIITILRSLKARRGSVYASAAGEFERILSEVRRDSEKIISKANALSLKDATGAPSPAGLHNIDKWLKEYSNRVCHPEKFSTAYAMQPPRGIIVSGVPGSGKSMMAMHIAKTLGQTLVRLDVGDAMGRYVGDTEKGFNDALRAVEELSPCILWIDEMEKAFQGGHEVTIRMIGKFLTWMQEKSDRGLSIFVFCTSNDITKMPSEMFRSGRFDEKYSIFMPSAKECGQIFESQIKHQCAIYKKSHDTVSAKKLFDTSAVNAKAFESILNSTLCIPKAQRAADTNLQRTNKFFIGADVTALIDKAKNIYINAYESTTGEYVFDSEKYLDCLKQALDATRTYGETNLDDIVKCYVKLNKNSFFMASSDVVVPYEGYDEIRYNSQKQRRAYGEKVEPRLYAKADEDAFLHGKCVYDRQLYLSVRNAINHLADTLIQQSY